MKDESKRYAQRTPECLKRRYAAEGLKTRRESGVHLQTQEDQDEFDKRFDAMFKEALQRKAMPLRNGQEPLMNDATIANQQDLEKTELQHAVFDQDSLVAFKRYAVNHDHLKTRVQKISTLPQFHELVAVPSDLQLRLRKLRNEWPNFREVIDQIESDLALTIATVDQTDAAPISFSPILMVGPPGCGKSSFMQALSEGLSLPMLRQSLERMMTSADLLGSSRMYSNTEPGALFNALTGTGGVAEVHPANFMLACDELDKLEGDERFKPANMLLSLLESSTNSRIQDACTLLDMDLSKLNILFTANEIESKSISAPLLSRLVVKQIEPLSFEQMYELARRLYADLVKEFKRPQDQIPKLLDEGVIALAKCSSVREQKAKLRQAMGHALVNNLPSLKIEIFEGNHQRRIGFY